ncbi:hypothetical protein [Brazilian marseillevirus]|uniref:hypothetical protein n=1 Tax=Brazilian marseillevirus TaxID=1813599 RepID=UPI0007843FD3|nr:hypothetical protein A3303_gp232 [Brazilian marseillevirus]AMQ10740.1 hypothetical protein [Brazilian marseillevirus]
MLIAASTGTMGSPGSLCSAEKGMRILCFPPIFVLCDYRKRQPCVVRHRYSKHRGRIIHKQKKTVDVSSLRLIYMCVQRYMTFPTASVFEI